MDGLSENREAIAGVDEEIARLFEKRMKLCAGVAEYKKEHGIPVKDRAREDFLIEKNRKLIEDPLLEEYYVDFLKGMMDISCR